MCISQWYQIDINGNLYSSFIFPPDIPVGDEAFVAELTGTGD